MTRLAFLRRPAALIAALSLLAAMAGPAAAVDGATYVKLTNEKRALEGRPPISLYAAVDKVAVERANRMAARDAFEHDLAYVAAGDGRTGEVLRIGLSSTSMV